MDKLLFAQKSLMNIYYMVAIIDLNKKEFELIHSSSPILREVLSPAKTLIEATENVKDFFIYENDNEILKEYFNTEYIESRLNEVTSIILPKIRCKIDGNFFPASFACVKGFDYSPTNKKAILTMYNPQENEFHYRDFLTHLNNRRCFYDRIESIKMKVEEDSVGIIYCNLNELKFINSTFGIEEGDNYICSFAQSLRESFGQDNCYRTSGDDFIIMITDIEKTDFLNQFLEFRKKIATTEYTIAAIGFSWKDVFSKVEYAIKEAEEMMNKDKRNFYENNPQANRRSGR